MSADKEPSTTTVQNVFANMGNGTVRTTKSGYTFTPDNSTRSYFYNYAEMPADRSGRAILRVLKSAPSKQKNKNQRHTIATKNAPTIKDYINAHAGNTSYVDMLNEHYKRQLKYGPVTMGTWNYSPQQFTEVMQHTPEIRVYTNKGPSESSYSYRDNYVRLGQSYEHQPESFRAPIQIKGPYSSTQNYIRHARSESPQGYTGSSLNHQLNHMVHSSLRPRTKQRWNEVRPFNVGQAWVEHDVSGLRSDSYAYIPVQQAQAMSSYNRGLYALQQYLRSAPDSKMYKQFDTGKLNMVSRFKALKGRDRAGLQQLRKQMSFFKEHPEIAQLLGGQAKRTVGMYSQLVNTINTIQNINKTIQNINKSKFIKVREDERATLREERLQDARDALKRLQDYRHLGYRKNNYRANRQILA